jgi:nicotinamidase-related amidase
MTPSTLPNPFAQELSPDNACCIMIDHQVGLFSFLTSLDPALLKNNVMGLAKTALAFNLPTILGTSWPQGPNGPTLPELVTLFGPEAIIDRPYVNFWNHPESKAAVVSTGRRKLIISGLATEVCVAFPAIAAAQEGYEVYAVIDASADWNPLVTQVTMQRLASAGVVVTTWVAVLAELANNAQVNGTHIARLLSEHVGQYSAAMANYLGVARNKQALLDAVGEPALMAHL